MAFSNKSEFFAVLADLLPVHYFEKAPVVRIVWELWISIRITTNSPSQGHQLDNPQMSVSSSGSSSGNGMDSFLLKEIAIEFNQRMVLLSCGHVKVSRDPSNYPIHKAVFDGTLDQIVELSFTDKATLTSLKLFGQEIDPFGNTPLKLAIRIGDYDAVRVLLKSGCAEPFLKPEQLLLQQLD